MNNPDEFVFDIANGDPGISRHLRSSLLAIKSATADANLRRQIDDALAGKTSMRSFGASEAFARIVDGVPRKLMDQKLHMPEEERERLAERGDREIDRLREAQSGTPATESRHPAPPEPSGAPLQSLHPADKKTTSNSRKPDREQIFTPDEDDEDDLYYQDRRNNGWLQ